MMALSVLNSFPFKRDAPSPATALLAHSHGYASAIKREQGMLDCTRVEGDGALTVLGEEDDWNKDEHVGVGDVT